MNGQVTIFNDSNHDLPIQNWAKRWFMIQFVNHDSQILVIQLALKMIQIMIHIPDMAKKWFVIRIWFVIRPFTSGYPARGRETTEDRGHGRHRAPPIPSCWLVSLFYYLLHFANDVVTHGVSTAVLVGAHSRAFWGFPAKRELQSLCRPYMFQEKK